MISRNKILILLLIPLIISCVSYPTASASENYKVLLFDETVTVLDNLTVHVLLNYKFMPLLDEGYYFDTWYINIHTAEASGITVEGVSGALTFTSTVDGNWTLLVIDLGSKVFSNQNYLLKISYFATDRVEVKGPEKILSMWAETRSSYMENVTLTVNIPKGYSLIEYEPPFLSCKESMDGVVLSGQRVEVGANESYYLRVKFADTVVMYNVTCRYTFTNIGSKTEGKPKFEVPGPLELGMQEVSQISYDPSPISTSYDESGNLRCKFRTSSIAPRENVTIIICFVAKITIPPAINDSYSGGLSEIPLNLEKYTTADNYWEVNDPTIRGLSQNLTENETNVLNKVKAIYSFVINNIEYDDEKYEAIQRAQNSERYGALKTYTLGRGVCADFSDLFVTLCRASGIPATRVDGYIYERDGLTSMLHAWVEVFIPRYGWLQIDPTWKLFGRLEGRHITEQIKKDSSEPEFVLWWVYEPFDYEGEYVTRLLAAGGVYRPDISVSASYEDEISIYSNLNLRLIINNYGNGTADSTNVTVGVPEGLMLLNTSLYSLGKMHEYESKDLNLFINANSVGNATIEISVRYQAEEGEIETQNYMYNVSIIKALTAISCNVSSSKLQKGNNVRIQGLIIPELPGKNVILEFTKPDGESLTSSVITNLDGSYNYTVTPDVTGLWSLNASWKGDSTYTGATSQTLKLTVVEPPPTGNLEIIVQDENEKPIGGATVSSTSQHSGQQVVSGDTGSDGSVTFSDLMLGNYTFQVSKNGYIEKLASVDVEAGATVELNIKLEEELESEPEKLEGIPGFPITSIMMGILVGIILVKWCRGG
ncbi:transglutaminase-like enzyme, predicted cysteine protease [Thaumarchaeota archaeon SCGC AB-539-E09]|nr:transglutaminase-like enzyme, predicted cysteine protease [Thaumarchaeota archaeon SCGC AB-539-E09]